MTARGASAPLFGVVVAGAIGPLCAQGRVISAEGAPAWGANVRLVPALTIGTLDGPAEYAFGSVSAVVGFADGSFVVHDSRQRQVRRYDAAGRFAANIGRTGEGPGEYKDVLGLESLGDTTIVLWDATLRRVTEFALDGSVRASTTLRIGSSAYGADVFGIDRAGIVSVNASFEPIRRYARYRLDGTLVDTVGAPVGSGGGFVMFTNDGARGPFPSEPMAVPYADGGLLTAHADTLGFRVIGNRVPRVVRRRHVPVRLSRDERREWEAVASHTFEAAKRWKVPPGVKRPEPKLATIPTVKPALRGIRSDRDGRVWLELYVAAEKRNVPPRPKGDTRPQLTWWERNAFDVFTGAGQYLGRVTLPAQHRLVDSRGDRIWAVSEGPDGEERIVVFRIVRG